jgi:hypothetical protein
MCKEKLKLKDILFTMALPMEVGGGVALSVQQLDAQGLEFESR